MELISNGATVNEKGGKKGKTPLFYAKNYETALLLLHYGADPSSSYSEIVNGNSAQVTAIEHLMKYNGEGAKAILDQYLTKKLKKDTLIMDFSIFTNKNMVLKKEGNDNNLISLLRIVEISEDKSLLLHPLLKTFQLVVF